MTIHLNVTDAVGNAGQHGIVRTERKLAAALACEPDVSFVAMDRGTLSAVSHAAVRAVCSMPLTGRPPRIEIVGRDPTPHAPSLLAAKLAGLDARVKRLRRQSALNPRPLVPAPGDTLVSAGMDWCHGVLPEAQRLIRAHGMRFVGFCYDTIPIDHPEWVDRSHFETDFADNLAYLAQIADTVVCISERTKADFLRQQPDYAADNVRVIQLGADAALDTDPKHASDVESIFDGEPFALYCSTIERRKNHGVLYRALRQMAQSGSPGNLVFVGKVGFGVGDLLHCLRTDPAVAGRVALVTECSDAYLSALYDRASFAVYPSFYEGWGLGVTEALAHRKQCLIASGSALEEAGLGACPVIHPLDTVGWATWMCRYFSDPPESPHQRTPTWADCATSLMKLVR